MSDAGYPENSARPTTGITRHEAGHEHSALWWNFGPYGPQDLHVHDCTNEGCKYVLVGVGRDCAPGCDHWLERLTMHTPKRLLEVSS